MPPSDVGRYYAGSAPYVRRGPPPMPQRVLGPLLILTSAGVLGAGVTCRSFRSFSPVIQLAGRSAR
jgi:hypothetical protein